jgi:hypothetical protein
MLFLALGNGRFEMRETSALAIPTLVYSPPTKSREASLAEAKSRNAVSSK